MKFRELVIAGMVLGGISLWLLKPLMHPWFPLLSDGEYYLSRMANFDEALWQGQLPPRWAPNFKFTLGYPVLNFNYPLPNVLGVVGIRLGLSVQNTMKLLLGAGLLTGSLGMYGWLKSQKRSSLAAITAAALFMLAPYQMYDALHRGSIGEFLALNYLPWLLWRIDQVAKNQTRSKLWTGLMFWGFSLSHNIVVMLAVPLLLAWTGVKYSRLEMTRLLPWLVVVSLLGSFFWLPALAEMKFIQLSQAPINNQYFARFQDWPSILGVTSLLNAAGNRNYEVVRQLGWASLVVVTLCLIVMIIRKRIDRSVVFWLVVWAVSSWLVTDESRRFWTLVSPLRFVQHPIRFLLFGALSSSIVAGWVIDNLKLKLVAIGLVVVAMLNYLVLVPKVQGYVPYDDEFLVNYPLTSAAGDEFDPIWYDRKQTADFAASGTEHFVNLPSDAKAVIDDWDGTKRTYWLELTAPTRVIEKTLYFPGWETIIDGKKMDLWPYREDSYGLINFPVEAGKHKIETKFTQNTWPRRMGNGLTLVGIIIVIGWEIKSRLSKNSKSVRQTQDKFEVRNSKQYLN